MGAAGDQENTACVNLQLCAGLESSMEGSNHAVGQRQMKRNKRRVDVSVKEAEDD